MENKIFVTLAFLITLGIAISPAIVSADSDNLNVTATINNVIPDITNITLSASSFNPTENSTTLVMATMDVYDENGVSDLLNSDCSCQVDNTPIFSAPVAKYGNTSCYVVSDLDAFTRRYQCSWRMDFYDSAENYSTYFSAGDQEQTVEKDTTTGSPNYDYTELIATYLGTNSIAWTTPSLDTPNVASDGTTKIYNSGNVQLNTNITGANLTASGKPDLDVGWFGVDKYANASTEIQLTTAVQVITGATVTQGSDVTPNPLRVLYWFFDTPATLQPATYTGQWVLGEYKP